MAATVCPDFVHVKHQLDLVAVHDVPGVRTQLVFDLGDKVGAAKQNDLGLAPEHDAQQVIEPGKVIHVRIGNKDVR